MALQILLAGRNKHDLDTLDGLLRQQPGVALTTRRLERGQNDPLEGASARPGLLVFHLSDQWTEELQAVAQWPAAGRPPLIVIGPANDTQVMRRAMQVGARDFFTWPAPAQELNQVVAQLARDRPADGGKHRLTAFINAKGGSGASVLACNTAHLLAKHFQQRVALLDLDLQFGTLPLYFDLHPERGLLDALEAVRELDAPALAGYTTRHDSGLQLLGNPGERLMLPGELSTERLGLLLDLLCQGYEQIVVDLPRQIDPSTNLVMERADQVVVVLQQTLTHIRDAKRLIGVLEDGLELPRDRILLVVNRCNPKSEISVTDIEKALDRDAALLIPNDFKAVSSSVNAGVPLYDQAPKAAVTRSLLALASRLGGIAAPSRTGLLSRLFSSSRSG